MSKEISPSSYLCVCGRQVDFFENTIREVKRMSLKKRQWLGEGGNRETEHIIIFEGGKMVDILCPKEGKQEKKSKFTEKQGQYLAFIHQYAVLHGKAPAEYDMQRYFNVSPPAVHEMVLTLEKRGLIERTPGQARSIRILVPEVELPRLI